MDALTDIELLRFCKHKFQVFVKRQIYIRLMSKPELFIKYNYRCDVTLYYKNKDATHTEVDANEESIGWEARLKWQNYFLFVALIVVTKPPY